MLCRADRAIESEIALAVEDERPGLPLKPGVAHPRLPVSAHWISRDAEACTRLVARRAEYFDRMKSEGI